MAEHNLQLDDGSHVAVMGSGPAGSFFSYFLLDMAERVGMDIQVDVYEPRDFSRPGPPGCNMCAGIVSESLVQTLAAEGINLPPTVIQRGIDAYMLHTDVGSVGIETPLHEKRIGAVYRGPGPRGIKEIKWGSFDGHLQSLAVDKGANVIHERVTEVSWNNDGRPQIKARGGSPQTYDLLAVAVGVNTAALKLFQGLELGYQPPRTTRTFIREYYLGQETVGRVLGNSVQVFLLHIPRLEFGMFIPKGDYVTMCLLGQEIDKELVQSFLDTPEVKQCFPPDLRLDQGACQCSPRATIQGAVQPFADRIVFLGDCGVTRYYKDGIGAAYRAAKSAATTAIFQGVSAADFRRHYGPVCRAIESDNTIGKVIFAVVRQIQKRRFARRAVLRMVSSEQQKEGGQRRMSMVMWDMYTGSASYRDIFLRTLHPAFWLRFGWDILASLLPATPNAQDESGRPGEELPMDSGALGKVYQPGDILIRQGEVGECMFVIQEGQVALMQEHGGEEVFLGVRSAGEILGEMAIFEKEVQMATVRALSQVRVLTVDKKNFLGRIHEDPSLAYRLFQLMSRRIRELSQQVTLLNKELDRLTEGDMDVRRNA
ncbi:MAG: cyclic nucleotide-binding domain-containing protein [Anaerolineae bacterium]